MKTGGKVGFAAAPVAVALLIVAALQVSEKRVHTTYWDKLGGLWTVCAGVTGPAAIPGKTYTDAECERLEVAYVQKMLSRMGKCVRGEFEFHEIKAWGHFAYNVGTARFCSSTAAKRLNAGERKAACAEISRFVYIGKKDCRLAANQCPGIPKRRAWERATCEGTNQ